MSLQSGRYTAARPHSLVSGWSLTRLTPPSRLFGANGLRLFSLPYAELRLTNDNVQFSKDGCYVLVQGFWSTGSESNTHLLASQSQQCR